MLHCARPLQTITNTCTDGFSNGSCVLPLFVRLNPLPHQRRPRQYFGILVVKVVTAVLAKRLETNAVVRLWEHLGYGNETDQLLTILQKYIRTLHAINQVPIGYCGSGN